MKILELIVEIILSPFTILLRLNSGNGKLVNKLARPLFCVLIAIVIVTLIVLVAYRRELFHVEG